LFVDGNNWFHSLRQIGVRELNRLDYARISRKLVRGRAWIETRYYVGRVPQSGDLRLYASQRRFLASLESSDSRISVHLGRLESRSVESRAARELELLIPRLSPALEAEARESLERIVRTHRRTQVLIEKAVDVMLAVDLVLMAERCEFDVAYLLSADGDFTPAVEAVRSSGKRVFAVSPSQGARLREACSAFIRLDESWFEDCYRRLP